MSDEHDWSEMRSGAMPEDWHEQNDAGYIPGGADAMAERILSEPSTLDDAAARTLARAMDGKVDTTKADRWNMRRDSVHDKTPKLRKPSPLDGINRLDKEW